MRLFTVTILLFIFSGSADAQESTLVVSDTMYASEKGMFVISDKDEWVYKSGNVADAANPALDTRGWTKFKPAALSEDDLDKDGRFEGWFRIRIKIKNRPNFTPPGILSLNWGASEIFANGKKIAAFGRLGHDKATFEENKFNRKIPTATNFQPDSTYVLALHVVDYDDPFSFRPTLKSGNQDKNILVLTNKSTAKYMLDFWNEHAFYDGLLSAVSATLSLLFWILFALNRNEDNIRRFAIGCMFLALLSISSAFSTVEDFSYSASTLFRITTTIAAVSYVCYIPIILAGVFSRKIPRPILIFMSVTYLAMLIGPMLKYGWILTLAIIPVAIAFYYLITSWKTLRGAQWAIVGGFLISCVFLIGFIVAINIFKSSENAMVLMLIYAVSPPLGMLIYVSTRFGEMITDVRTNAAQVLQLSEEKRNQALNQQKVLEAEVEKQTAELRLTLTDLKATQSQLIQSEKMASLGELTAGIAHEIQNPLNFVNNFSDVSIELLDEMNEELDKGDAEEAKAIAEDIKSNLEKIAHHGKRADGIVKGMLQHSRASSGQKEPTDINALTDEYLRLAYHGLRAKDKSFNSELITHFDESLPNVSVIPQDVGRVLLNLFTNAFYATQKRKEAEGESFRPSVAVSTSVGGNSVEIRVTDNGGGIPEDIKEKIFQPFFTTKPTGEGTGLGLSLAYDILKAHGGGLKVETKVNEGTTFIVQLIANDLK